MTSVLIAGMIFSGITVAIILIIIASRMWRYDPDPDPDQYESFIHNIMKDEK